MSPLYTHNGLLIAVDSLLAVSNACCCSGGSCCHLPCLPPCCAQVRWTLTYGSCAAQLGEDTVAEIHTTNTVDYDQCCAYFTLDDWDCIVPYDPEGPPINTRDCEITQPGPEPSATQCRISARVCVVKWRSLGYFDSEATPPEDACGHRGELGEIEYLQPNGSWATTPALPPAYWSCACPEAIASLTAALEDGPDYCDPGPTPPVLYDAEITRKPNCVAVDTEADCTALLGTFNAAESCPGEYCDLGECDCLDSNYCACGQVRIEGQEIGWFWPGSYAWPFELFMNCGYLGPNNEFGYLLSGGNCPGSCGFWVAYAELFIPAGEGEPPEWWSCCPPYGTYTLQVFDSGIAPGYPPCPDPPGNAGPRSFTIHPEIPVYRCGTDPPTYSLSASSCLDCGSPTGYDCYRIDPVLGWTDYSLEASCADCTALHPGYATHCDRGGYDCYRIDPVDGWTDYSFEASCEDCTALHPGYETGCGPAIYPDCWEMPNCAASPEDYNEYIQALNELT